MKEIPAPVPGDTPPEWGAHGAKARSLQALRMLLRRILRRTRDIVVSGAALVLLAPLLTVVALLVMADSPGPVLSRQDRGGRRRTYQLLSFRTTHGSDVTRIGQTLRRYALDELPRLWNVLAGDIDLVILWRSAQSLNRTAGAQ